MQIGSASDSRFHDPRYRPHQEHTHKTRFFPSQKWCADSLSVDPTLCTRLEWPHTHVKWPTHVKYPAISTICSIGFMSSSGIRLSHTELYYEVHKCHHFQSDGVFFLGIDRMNCFIPSLSFGDIRIPFTEDRKPTGLIVDIAKYPVVDVRVRWIRETQRCCTGWTMGWSILTSPDSAITQIPGKEEPSNLHQEHTSHLVLFNSFFPHAITYKRLEPSPSHSHLGSFTPVLPEPAWQQPPLSAASSHSPINSSSL